MIDLHLHTTASDGLVAPDALVPRLQQSGIRLFSVTDHDTVAALPIVRDHARTHGLGFLPGIEVTAVDRGSDVHILGYGFDCTDRTLLEFLAAQRADRVSRARSIMTKLADLGAPLDIDAVLSQATAGRAIGRPQIARALVARGHVATVSDAFDRWIGRDGPAYVARRGASAADVVRLLQSVGGIASMAHPAVTRRDELIAPLAAAGMTALEVWHSDHDEPTTAKYEALAAAHGLEMTGGSDFHGDAAGRVCRIGRVGVPPERFDRLVAALHRAGSPALETLSAS